MKGWHQESERHRIARLKGKKVTQTLIFPKKHFTRNEAIDWAKKHDFKYNTSREEKNTIRIRQVSPSKIKKYGGTFPIGDKVQGIYGETR